MLKDLAKPFIVSFMITFVCAVIGSGAGLTHEPGERLMIECIVAALIGAIIIHRLSPLLRPTSDE